jgi:SAM-dependent methyltransferase
MEDPSKRDRAAYDVVGRYKQDEVNGFTAALVDRMLDAAKIAGAETVLDAMAGDGNLSQRLYTYCRSRDLPVPRITVLELSPVQSEFARGALAPLGASVLCGDVLAMRDSATGYVLPGNVFDRVLIKSSSHEIPSALQPDLYRSIFRVLRPGGIFVNVGFLFDDPEERREVRELARVKDRLAGMDAAVRNRHFLLREEFYGFLRDAGFVSVQGEGSFEYRIRSQVVAEQYYPAERRLSADLENQVAQIQALTLRKNGRIRFEGTSSILLFPGEITTARKPATLESKRVVFGA